MRELDGRVAVVTGAASGIGLAMTEAFLAEGMSVVMADVQEDALTARASRLESAGAPVLGVLCDVTDPAAVQALADATLDHFGGVHVLCNNAGVGPTGPMLLTTPTEWQWLIAVNVLGVAYGVTTFAPLMVEAGGGRIINIASVSGLYGGPTTAHYAASKAGLISLTQVLARWGAEHNILVNSISPGIIETELTREELRSGGGAGVVALTLLKRPGEVGDVSSIAVMLASDEQNYMTGQTISPNGGSYFTD